MDLALVTTAGIMLWKVHTEEMMLLFVYFAVSSVISASLCLMDAFDSIGLIWFAMFSMWISVFSTTTKNRYIAMLYLWQQVTCILIVLQWRSEYSFLYDYFEYIIAILYVMQLGCEYGNYHRRDNNQRDDCNVDMAYNEA